MTESQIVKGLLAAVVAHDLYTTAKNKAKRHQLQEENNTLLIQLAHTTSAAKYLCSMLDKHEISADEFDLIALNDPM